MADLDDSFAKLLGRLPSEVEREELYRVRDALGLKNNDALWLVLMALQFYESSYSKFPELIRKSAADTLRGFNATADATLAASAEAAKADLAKAVAAAAEKVAKDTASRLRWQWVLATFVVVLAGLLGAGRYVGRAGSHGGLQQRLRLGLQGGSGPEGGRSLGQYARGPPGLPVRPVRGADKGSLAA